MEEIPAYRRRRAPGWVRQMSSRQLHALASSLRSEAMDRDLSSGQEWLWRATISELEYRHRRDLAYGGIPTACTCEFCAEPFENYE